MPAFDLPSIARRLSSVDAARTEADVQSDVRALLLTNDFGLEEQQVVPVTLESPAGQRRRIDVDAGQVLIEVKRDLRPAHILKDGIDQLGGYVQDRTAQNGGAYVGVLTDGATWLAYQLGADSKLHEVTYCHLDTAAPNGPELIAWLGAILATTRDLAPTAAEVDRRLGVTSPGYQLDQDRLRELWAATHTTPEAALKRDLWARLLTAAFGTPFSDAAPEHDALFCDHTYLVLVATCIGHAVLGLPVATLDPVRLLRGAELDESRIRGVAGAEFFDWLLNVDGGAELVQRLARRVAQFDWAWPDHDVLKHLYQSVIDDDRRKRLGEYYTPDYLAEHMVEEAVTDPLAQRVLDPACGSGTFLFYAVRRYLDAAETAGRGNLAALAALPEQVIGVDVHPVAVVLARVTYLLAIGADRLRGERDALVVPVYLGDSLQWQIDHDLLSPAGLAIATTGATALFPDALHFPESVLGDPTTFDRLVDELTAMAAGRPRGSAVPPINPILERYKVPSTDQPTLRETFAHLCWLHDEHRNRVWGAYVRNLAHPLWLARDKVDVCVGNPPWLAYLFMTEAMQRVFRERSRARGQWAGGRVATQQDLSAYFLTRCVELYLRPGGRFAFLMPRAVLSRLAYKGFRSGNWAGSPGGPAVQFGRPTDLEGIDPQPFPVPAAIVVGQVISAPERLTDPSPRPLPGEAIAFRGHLSARAIGSWKIAELELASTIEPIVQGTGPRSPYAAAFRNGATVYPRMLFCVDHLPPGGLGLPRDLARVRSHRSAEEKPPWKTLPNREGVIEKRFLWCLHLGSTVLPFRLLEPLSAVLPIADGRLFDPLGPDTGAYPDLVEWWRAGEELWESNRSAPTKQSLLEWVNYHGKLSAQLPIPSIRVVYTKAGNTIAAAVVHGDDVLIDHKLYWAACDSPEEARYLSAVLNAPVVTSRTAPLQSRGLFGPRDIDKYVWSLPIPRFTGTPVQRELVDLAEHAEEIAAAVSLDLAMQFTASRSRLRRALVSDGVTAAIDHAATALLGPSVLPSAKSATPVA